MMSSLGAPPAVDQVLPLALELLRQPLEMLFGLCEW
jgi:hypothetical protein